MITSGLFSRCFSSWTDTLLIMKRNDKNETERIKKQHPKSHLNKPRVQICPFRADCTYRNEAVQMHRGKEKNKESRADSRINHWKPNLCEFQQSFPQTSPSFWLSNIRAKEHMPMSIVWTPNEATRHTVTHSSNRIERSEIKSNETEKMRDSKRPRKNRRNRDRTRNSITM